MKNTLSTKILRVINEEIRDSTNGVSYQSILRAISGVLWSLNCKAVEQEGEEIPDSTRCRLLNQKAHIIVENIRDEGDIIFVVSLTLRKIAEHKERE